jgi:ATP-binding cassette subfamily C (CFTR/MRP) protein 4
VHTTTLLTLQNFVNFVFYFFPCKRSVQKCDQFLLKSLDTKLQTHFLRRYRTKSNTALAFVHVFRLVNEHAIRVNESFTLLTLTVNNYFRLESQQISIANQFRLVNDTFRIYMTKCCVFLSVVATSLAGTPLTSQYVFALSNLYESMKFSVNIALSLAVTIFSEALVSIQRIKNFLLNTHEYENNLVKAIRKLDSTKNKCIPKFHQTLQKKSPGVNIEDLSCKWDQSLTKYALNNINFNASLGELVSVIGKAGSGKSTLLEVILKELDPMKGTRDVQGTISYACQEPWIFSASIRQNIIFGQDFDLEKYQKVVKICALEHDISLLPSGDQTFVGERGVMLSGGQKARINLARAIYRDADIYLLDDPLSAVDAHVGQQIFNKCIVDHLRNKCVVLVTHQIQYLRNVDRMYLLESGMIVDSGKYEKFVGLEKYFAEKNDQTFAETVNSSVLKAYDVQSETREHRSSGTTDKNNYTAYCSAAGQWLFTCLVVLLFTLAQFWGSIVDGFVTFWVNLEQGDIYLSSDELLQVFTTNNCLYIYTGFLLCFILTSHISALVFSKYCRKASKNLHNNMLITILNTTMTFFNHHSSGRILNRFSKDLGCIDEVLPISLINTITVLLTILGTFVIVVVTNYWMIIPTVLLLVICVYYCIIFQPTSRNLKRTEGISTSL